MIVEKYFKSLTEVAWEAYCENKNYNKEKVKPKEIDWENKKDDYEEKIKDIAKHLDIDLKKFKNKSNKYEIPNLISSVMIQYLVEDSKKGSFISKIKTGNLNTVTTSEKLEFMNRAFDRVLNSCKNEEDEEYVEILRAEYKKIIEILQESDEKKYNLKKILENSINKNINDIYGIKDTDGIVKFDQGKIDKYIEEPDYKSILTPSDSDLLVDSYLLIIESLNKKWEEIIKTYLSEKDKYMMLNGFEDADKLVDVELCMLKDALDATYRPKDDIKQKLSKEELNSIKAFLSKDFSFKNNRVIKILENIIDDDKNDL